jgi:tetrahydromethanopterin S-methyltransferase subunit B
MTMFDAMIYGIGFGAAVSALLAIVSVYRASRVVEG